MILKSLQIPILPQFLHTLFSALSIAVAGHLQKSFSNKGPGRNSRNCSVYCWWGNCVVPGLADFTYPTLCTRGGIVIGGKS
jgi:hypothetical protein